MWQGVDAWKSIYLARLVSHGDHWSVSRVILSGRGIQSTPQRLQLLDPLVEVRTPTAEGDESDVLGSERADGRFEVLVLGDASDDPLRRRGLRAVVDEFRGLELSVDLGQNFDLALAVLEQRRQALDFREQQGLVLVQLNVGDEPAVADVLLEC